VLLAYLDESYTKHKYWIAALVCPESDLRPLTKALDDIVEQAASKFPQIPPRSELHGYSLFHGKDDWASLSTMVRARIGVYDSALSAIGASNARIIVRGVYRPGLERRYSYPDHPHTVVLGHLVERVDELAESLGEQVLMIADEVDKPDTHRRGLWWWQKHSTPGWRARQLTQVVDTLHFAPSNASRLLQGVDLVAFLKCRMDSLADKDTRAIETNRKLWAQVGHCLHHQQCWYP
jgi:hypothetical protein